MQDEDIPPKVCEGGLRRGADGLSVTQMASQHLRFEISEAVNQHLNLQLV